MTSLPPGCWYYTSGSFLNILSPPRRSEELPLSPPSSWHHHSKNNAPSHGSSGPFGGQAPSGAEAISKRAFAASNATPQPLDIAAPQPRQQVRVQVPACLRAGGVWKGRRGLDSCERPQSPKRQFEGARKEKGGGRERGLQRWRWQRRGRSENADGSVSAERTQSPDHRRR